MCICPQVLGWLPIVKLTQNTWDCLIEYSDSPNVLESAEKNAENTKLLHIRNSIAWSCFFREIWVEYVGGWWELREGEMGWIVFGVGQLCKKTELHFRFWHLASCHRSLWVMAGHRRGCLYGKFCDRTSSDVSHHSIDGISEGVDGTSQRSCAQIKTKAYWGMWRHIGQWQLLHSIPNMPKYHGGFAKCQFVNGC